MFIKEEASWVNKKQAASQLDPWSCRFIIDWNWCPENKSFECSKGITFKMVKEKINLITKKVKIIVLFVVLINIYTIHINIRDDRVLEDVRYRKTKKTK